MEQYVMPKKLDFKNLRFCLDHYQAESLFIRLKGSSGGTVKVDQNLVGKTLDFKKNKTGLHILVDAKEVFHFPLKDYYQYDEKGFSLAYERFEQMNGVYRMVMLGTGEDPYNPELPEPTRSFLRHALDDHLLEIYFEGRVHLKFHSWWNKEAGWKYWTVR